MIIAPGSTIGIIGGGQLGRMLAIAAAQLGYRCHIYSPEESGPASEVAAYWTQGAYDDMAELARFAASVHVITYEFENIPVGPVGALADICVVAPGADALAIAQDRAKEKRYFEQAGGRAAPWAAVDSLSDLESALGRIGAPAILKTRRFGYDGKGQVRLANASEAAKAWREIGEAPSVLEGLVRFSHEFSIILVRTAKGETRTWTAPLNTHKDGVLAISSVPAPPEVADQAEQAAGLARKVADALSYVGVLTLEFFATEDGPVFNEMAPRVHNSGHWTIEGAVTSQFENHIRAICGLPIGDTSMRAARAEMRNLLGKDATRWLDCLSEPGAHLHLYGKREARPGRKMGHVTRLFES